MSYLESTNRTIEVTVSPNGETKVETNGFTGSDCKDASRFIESALGQMTDETLKPEFHSHSCEPQSLDNCS
ncbi:MAG: DUF2997 domain-containing protein [Pirellulaceae bacterium]